MDRLLTGDVTIVRSQDGAHPPTGDRPLLPFLLGGGQLSLDAVGLLPQPVDSTASGEFVLFQQSDDRRHLQPPGERLHDTSPLPPNHRTYA
ncbi:hypothetical protein ACWD5R_44380 [Streptomyces sp. NPDC002514]|uniref:hypothetical protein n=1 Tax=Streptomyces sp. NPDC001270 TaxID=3364554 RepID=UPI003678159F